MAIVKILKKPYRHAKPSNPILIQWFTFFLNSVPQQTQTEALSRPTEET
jgi:hypothetical protein